MTFADRKDAGQQLAVALAAYRSRSPIVLALPRGGVPVAVQVADALDAPLGLIIVRKLGLPYQPEFAMGAVVAGDPPLVVRNEAVISMARVSPAEFAAVRERELAEARRRVSLYLGQRKPMVLKGRTVVIIDDGIATGATMRAAIMAVRKQAPAATVLAVPVAATSTLDELRSDVDDIVCLEPHPDLGAVGFYYRDFTQVSDAEVIAAVEKMGGTRAP